MDRYRILLLLPLISLIHAFNLEETVDLSKQNDPGYRAKVLKLQALRLNGRIAAGKLAPQVDLAFYGKHTTVLNTPTAATGSVLLTIKADIYNAMEISKYKLGKLESKEALTKLHALDVEHSMQTIARYFDTLKAYSNLKVAQFALSQYQKNHQEASEKETAGLISSAETLVSLASLDAAKLQLTVAQNDLDHKVKTLNGQINSRITALDVYTDLKVPELSVPPLDELVNHALSSGFRIELTHLQLKKARNSLNLAENSFAPKATVSYERAQPIDTVRDHFFKNDYSAQTLYLTFGINAFAGFAGLNSLKQGRIAYDAAESSLAEEQYNIKLSIEKAYKDYTNSQLQAHASLIALRSANASLFSVSERYEADKASELEYTTAIAQATNAQEKFFTSIYTMFAGYLNLKATATVLDHEDIKKVNKFLKTEISLVPSSDPS